MSSQLSATPRQALTPRQSELVQRLLAAAEQELAQVGHEALSIRAVAHRAGLSPATAYTYLASKDHLFAELFWRRLGAPDGTPPPGGTPTQRVQHALRHLGELIAEAPEVTAAATKSLLGSDPQVARLRRRIGTLFADRIREAVGEGADPRAVEAVRLAFFGALLHAGMGLFSFHELTDRLDDIVAVIMEGTA